MNAKKRLKNRANAAKLAKNKRAIDLSKHICEECGEPGGHWVSIKPMSLEATISGVDDQQGFWTCAKFYGPDGRRIDTSDQPKFGFGFFGM